MICEGAQVSICWITPQAEWAALPVPRSPLLGIIIHCHRHMDQYLSFRHTLHQNVCSLVLSRFSSSQQRGSFTPGRDAIQFPAGRSSIPCALRPARHSGIRATLGAAQGQCSRLHVNVLRRRYMQSSRRRFFCPRLLLRSQSLRASDRSVLHGRQGARAGASCARKHTISPIGFLIHTHVVR